MKKDYQKINEYRVLHADCVEVDCNWRYQNVYSPFARIYRVEEGICSVGIKDCFFELNEQDLLLIPPFTIHSYHCESYCKISFIHFGELLYSKESLFDQYTIQYKKRSTTQENFLLDLLLDLNSKLKLRLSDPNKYDNHKDLLIQNRYTPLKSVMLNNAYLVELLFGFLRSKIENSPCSNGSISFLISFISQHLLDELNLTILSEACHFSPSYLSRLFKKTMGLTISDYIHFKRIEFAKHYLLNDTCSIGEIADILRYTDIAHFSKQFRKLEGVSPSIYRKDK